MATGTVETRRAADPIRRRHSLAVASDTARIASWRRNGASRRSSTMLGAMSKTSEASLRPFRADSDGFSP